MKSIIFFSKDLKIGGMEKSLVILLNRLVNFFDVTLCLENVEGALLQDVDKRIKLKEYKLFLNKNKLLQKILNFIKRFIWTLKYKNKYYFSCNYATYSKICSKLALISSKNNSIYIHSNYYEVYHKNKFFVKQFSKSVFIEKFQKIIFVSNESMNSMKKCIPTLTDKSFVISNLIDYEQIIKKSKVVSSVSINTKNKNFVFIGRLENESKNLELLIDSIGEAYKKDRNIRLYIVGDGKDYNLCEEKIKKKNLTDCIILLGETTNPYAILKKSDCLILTSNYEGYPVVYNEALVLNKYIITTIKCSDDLINISNYSNIVNNNVKDISNAILNFKKELKYNNLDFFEINNCRLKKIIDLINN